ncbi:DUF371 domain-containing protein [Algihabitans albus]|uniref:DUF371 domain-containing protein n=1 Tax=Algihabitans albus TaxID=2164067 RepID=UPI0013C321A0|nr:DUF371 domain-containing protein [Algihabitans albus]
MHAPSGPILTARGHPNVRASHSKTLELVPEADLSPRGTCVLGVALEGDMDAVAGLRGAVELTLTCQGMTQHLRATLNPAWLPGEPLILRRRTLPLTRRTFGFAADKGAADLDRNFIAGLSDSTARLEMEISPTGAHAPAGALFLAGPAGREDARLAAARRLADLRLTRGLEGLLREIAAGGRVLLESDDLGLQAEAVRLTAEAGGQATLVGGWSAAEGARALSGLAAETWSRLRRWPNGKPARRDLLARLADSGAGLLLPLPAGQGEGLLSLVAKTVGDREAVLIVAPNDPQEESRRGSLIALAEAPLPQGEVWLVVAECEPGEAGQLDSKLAALARRLQAAGVATKTLAAALAETTHLSKRDAFNALIKDE